MTLDAIVYVDDQEPGITRRKVRHGWGYWDPQGKRITDRDEIDRLNGIGLPPAYTDAWFCPDPNGHIQATAKDDKGRKQYRYHPDFRQAQEAAKYDRCVGFAHHLPRLRERVEADLKLRGMCKEKAVAAVVRLLDLGTIRVGISPPRTSEPGAPASSPSRRSRPPIRISASRRCSSRSPRHSATRPRSRANPMSTRS